jgi:uncharacterized protein (TIGR03083 family)
METRAYRIELGQKAATRLTQFLHTLSPDAWRYPSACDAWEVGDVVAHLAWVAEVYIDMITQGRRGDLTPWENFPDPHTIDLAAYHQFVAQTALTYRQHHGDRLLATFTEGYDSLHHLLRSLGPEDWDKPCFHPFGFFPVHMFVNLRISELAMHEWDIRSRLDPTFHLWGESLPLFMERVPALRGFYPGAPLSTPIRYRFALTGPAASTQDILVEGEKARMEPAGHDQAAVTFHCDTEAFILLMYGRITQEATMASGRLRGEGDHQLIQTFGQYFGRHR